MHDIGYRIQDTRIQDTVYQIPDSEWRIPDSGYKTGVSYQSMGTVIIYLLFSVQHLFMLK